MTIKREQLQKKQMRKNIAQLCAGMEPVAKTVFYTPQYQKQKDSLAAKFPLKKLIDKDEILDIQQAIASGDVSAAAERLSELNSRLEDFEARMDKRSSYKRKT